MTKLKINFNDLVPQEIISVVEKIEKAGFEIYLVGGCVRDMAMNIQPKD
jgi:poly(A) polymerase